MQTMNRFLDFANELIAKYHGFGGAYGPIALIYPEEEKQEPSEAAYTQQNFVTNLYRIQNIREENHLYTQNLTFLTTILENRLYQKLYPGVEKQVEKTIREEFPKAEKQTIETVTRLIQRFVEKEGVDRLEVLRERLQKEEYNKEIKMQKEQDVLFRKLENIYQGSAYRYVNTQNINSYALTQNKYIQEHHPVTQEQLVYQQAQENVPEGQKNKTHAEMIEKLSHDETLQQWIQTLSHDETLQKWTQTLLKQEIYRETQQVLERQMREIPREVFHQNMEQLILEQISRVSISQVSNLSQMIHNQAVQLAETMVRNHQTVEHRPNYEAVLNYHSEETTENLQEVLNQQIEVQENFNHQQISVQQKAMEQQMAAQQKVIQQQNVIQQQSIVQPPDIIQSQNIQNAQLIQNMQADQSLHTVQSPQTNEQHRNYETVLNYHSEETTENLQEVLNQQVEVQENFKHKQITVQQMEQQIAVQKKLMEQQAVAQQNILQQQNIVRQQNMIEQRPNYETVLNYHSEETTENLQEVLNQQIAVQQNLIAQQQVQSNQDISNHSIRNISNHSIRNQLVYENIIQNYRIGNIERVYHEGGKTVLRLNRGPRLQGPHQTPVTIIYSEESASDKGQQAEIVRLQKQVNEVVRDLKTVEEKTVIRKKEMTTQQQEIVKEILKTNSTVWTEGVGQDMIRREVQRTLEQGMPENLDRITTKVYRRLEEKLKIERGRRGMN